MTKHAEADKLNLLEKREQTTKIKHFKLRTCTENNILNNPHKMLNEITFKTAKIMQKPTYSNFPLCWRSRHIDQRFLKHPFPEDMRTNEFNSLEDFYVKKRNSERIEVLETSPVCFNPLAQYQFVSEAHRILIGFTSLPTLTVVIIISVGGVSMFYFFFCP